MTLLNVSFGIYAFLPQGWLFMISVIVLECLVITNFLLHKRFDMRVFGVVALTNFISGLAGIMISLLLNGGWYLVVWFPWVSSHEIDLSNQSAIQVLIVMYLSAFLLTLVLESSINFLFLRKYYPRPKIVKATILANILSYAIGSLVLYSYSFH